MRPDISILNIFHTDQRNLDSSHFYQTYKFQDIIARHIIFRYEETSLKDVTDLDLQLNLGMFNTLILTLNLSD